MCKASHIILQLGHKYIKGLEEIMISHENKTKICLWHQPKMKIWRVLSFQIQGHLTQGWWWNVPKNSKPRWFHSKSEGRQPVKTTSVKKKSHLTCCKSNPLSSPVKWVYRAYGTCWLLGILQRQICWWRILCIFPYFLLQIYYSLPLKYFLQRVKFGSSQNLNLCILFLNIL